jgi:hypothetical protein
MRDRFTRRSVSRAAALALFGAAVVACGVRGPLDSDVIQEVASDGGGNPGPGPSVDSGGGGEDANPGVDASAPVDATPAVDAPHEASLINCGTCVAQSCGTQIVSCLTNTTCAAALQCIATTCLAGADGGGGGGLGNLGCFTNCAGGNPANLAGLLGIIQCITTSCGSDCGSVLGGLGGLGGFGGRTIPNVSPNAGQVIFSEFPEICGSR